MRKKILISGLLFIAGVVFFVISSSGEASYPHYQLKEFYEKLQTNPKSMENRYMTLYGNVKEGSIKRSGLKAHFILEKDSQEIAVFFTGKTLLPDTFKDGSQAGTEGVYNAQKKIFIAEKVMAKCASRYEAYPPSSKEI